MSKRIYFNAFHMICMVHPGRQFAARHAECVFVLGPTPQIAGQYIRDTRARAQQQGRNPEDILFFAYVKVITGDTEAAARKKYDEFFEQISYDGGLALLSGWSGLDFGKFDPDQPLEYIETNAVRTLVHAFTEADPSRKWTMRDLARFVGIGGAGPVLVGAPEQIADSLQEWVRAGVHGFNLAYAITPGSFVDFIECVVPVLTLGGARRFLIKPRDGGRSIAFLPRSGDLIVMGGRCQSDWVHGVPKTPGMLEGRISVNFQSAAQARRAAPLTGRQ